MRAACLQAQADRASPVVLKAVLRAVSIAWSDFLESVSSPGRLAIVVLFVVSSLFLPVSAWLRAIMPTEPSRRAEAMSSCLRTIRRLAWPTAPWISQTAGAMRRRGLDSPRIVELNDEERQHERGDGYIDIDLSESAFHDKYD